MVAASVLVGVPVQLSGAQTRAEFTASWSTTSIAEGSSSTLTVSTADTSVMDADEILVTLHVGRAESTADTSDIEVRDSGGNVLSPSEFSANSDHGGGSVYIKQAHGETVSPLVSYQQAKTAVFTVTTIDDADTSDEDLAVWVYVNGYLAGAQILRLTTDPAFTFGSRSYTATEGGTAATVEVRLPEAPSSTLTIPIEVKSRVGATAADHSTIPASLTFTTSDTTKTFTVTAVDDTDDDDGESITIGFGTPVPTGYVATDTTVVNLADNDAILVSNTAERENDIGELSARDFAQGFTTGSHTAGYTIDSIELTLSTDSGTNHAVPIVKLVSGSAAHTGTATTLTGPTSLTANTTKDYTFTAPSGTTLAASTTYWAVVEASSGGNDVAWSYTLTDEDTKQAGWSIADSRLARGVTSTGSFSDVTSGEAQMLRINGSFVTGPAFKFGSRTYTATEGGTAATVEVELVNSPGGPSSSVTVPIEVKTRVGATAADHSTVPASLTFTTSDTTKTFTVTATDDTDDDDGESVIIGFGTAPSGYTLVGDTIVSLADNDAILVSNTDETGEDRLRLVANDFAQAFTTGTHTAGYTLTSIELTLFASGSNSTSPIVKLISGTAAHTGTATTLTAAIRGVDETISQTEYTFTAPSGTTLAASTTYWVVIEIAATGGDVFGFYTNSANEDAKQAGWSIANESLFRTASSTGQFDSTSLGPQMLRINGSLVTGPAFKFGSRSYTATEGGTAATVEVELVNSPGGPSSSVTVPIEVKTRVGATAADHSTVPSSLTFTTSDTRKTFTVTATDDTDDDKGESIIIGFGTAPTGYTLVGDTIVNLVDDEPYVLVSNIEETGDDRLNLATRDIAQAFTTGTHTAGYTLTSIELKLSTRTGVGIDNEAPIVKLISGNAAHTGTATTLTGPQFIPTGSALNHTFTAPSGTTLAASTTYWVVIEVADSGGDVFGFYTNSAKGPP